MARREQNDDDRHVPGSVGARRGRDARRGVVQGVGFRPFIYRLAKAHRLAGWVCNTSTCVEIEVEGDAASPWNNLSGSFPTKAPDLARVDGVVALEAEPFGQSGFVILASRRQTATEALDPSRRLYLRRLLR